MAESKLPYPILNKGDCFELSAIVQQGSNPIPKFTFIWDDKYKKKNEREQIMAF